MFRTARTRALPPTCTARTTRPTARTTRPAPVPRRASAAVAACAAAAVLGALLAAPVAQAAPASPGAERPSASAPAAQGRHTGPQIHRFLTWFYGDHGPTRQQRDKHVSAFLKGKQEQNPGYDVILCAQNTPRDIEVGPVTVGQSVGFGWATVTAYWGDGTTSTSTAYVALDSRPIELHDVVCAQ
ncbi:hypothetical protein [Streptomyces sp. NBC_01795]|uniref:hypothetical protein n=1 Tax=Streptomyces sp. NBC_01795 TaxID=2975943 RepID=UPI002DDA4CDF|nr:hypothetical protein [Streptomyces sp. NBC_01795]